MRGVCGPICGIDVTGTEGGFVNAANTRFPTKRIATKTTTAMVIRTPDFMSLV
jgi:hypothetical protein